MTIKELREKMEGLPEDMLVIIDGYEEGYDKACGGSVIPVSSVNSPSWSGNYDDPIKGQDEILAFHLSR